MALTDCNRMRERVSLELDDELSPHEASLLERHLSSCPACAGFASDARRYTEALRSATLARAPVFALRRRSALDGCPWESEPRAHPRRLQPSAVSTPSLAKPSGDHPRAAARLRAGRRRRGAAGGTIVDPRFHPLYGHSTPATRLPRFVGTGCSTERSRPGSQRTASAVPPTRATYLGPWGSRRQTGMKVVIATARWAGRLPLNRGRKMRRIFELDPSSPRGRPAHLVGMTSRGTQRSRVSGGVVITDVP
jgi:hypothetical protein